MSWYELDFSNQRGWPWPEKGLGFLDEMYGPGGWCRACGVPFGEQTGHIVLQAKGMASAPPAWVPHLLSAYCVDSSLGERILGEFEVELREIYRPRRSVSSESFQIMVPVSPDAWFDEGALTEVLVDLHGVAGESCGECGVWKWRPIDGMMLPVPSIRGVGDADVVASPEWFGSGLVAFRQDAFSAGLAALLGDASKDMHPRSWSIRAAQRPPA